MTRPLFVSSLAVVASVLVACAGNDGTHTPSTTTDPTHPSTNGGNTNTADPNAPLDPKDDPVPADQPELSAFDGSADVAPDLSCFCKPMPVAHGAPSDREFHLIELGGQDTDRVGALPVDLFLSNKIDKPDASPMAKNDAADKMQTGIFHATAHPGFIAYRVAAAPGYVSIVGLDLEVPESGPVLPAVPTADKVFALSALIGGGDFEPTKGAGRAVVRIVDCKAHPLVNAHVVLEVDGKIAVPAKDAGVRRSYFGDSELPSPNKLTSRSGVVTFLEVPETAKSIRVVARGKVKGDTKVLGVRSVPLVSDGVATAKVGPWTAP